jgi:hypothetical protein
VPACPKCGHQQAAGKACERCGVVFAKLAARAPSREAQREVEQDPTLQYLLSGRRLTVEQEMRSFAAELTDWGQEGSYSLTNAEGRVVGWAQVQGKGLAAFLLRQALGAWRPRNALVFSTNEAVLLEIHRRPSLFSGVTTVETAAGVALGSLRSTQFLIFSTYELIDERGFAFARIRTPLFRKISLFPSRGRQLEAYVLRGANGEEQARVVRKWAGNRKELYSEADDFEIDFGARAWTLAQRAVILATLFTIDFDYYESGHGPGNVTDRLLSDA